MAKQQNQPQQHPIADKFSDDEMGQIQRFGQALGGGATDFDEEVERALEKRGAFPRAREAGAAKMHAAQTGGSEGLGPTEAEQALAKQQTALQQQQATAGAVQAQQAQAGRSGPPTPPPAPSGPQGTTQPYSSQAGAVGGSGQGPSSQEQQQPPPAPEGEDTGGGQAGQ